MRWLIDPNYADDTQQAVAWMIGVGLLGLVMLWRHARLQAADLRRTALGLLVACTLLASWANFFQSRNNGSWIHRWDLFHTYVGAKYFSELGYDHLYDCAYVFGVQQDPHAFRRVDRVRDLGSGELLRKKHLLEHNDCSTRFSPERARAFTHDVMAFSELGLQPRWQDTFKDKGYNGTPFYTVLGRAMANRVPVEYGSMLMVALVDVLLIALAIVVVVRTRGLAIACLVLALLATCYPGRFVHMGGSFLRFDYLAALILGLCALASKRPALAGLLLTYAALVRIFPALYVVGALIAYGVTAVRERKVPRDALLFCAGGLAGLVLLGGATFALGRGAHDWHAWWLEVQSHTRQSADFRIGFQHMFMLDGNLLGPEGAVKYWDKALRLAARHYYYQASALLLIAPLLLRARHWDPATFAAFFGTVAFFLVFVATRYYYVVLVIPLLADPRVIGERAYALVAALLLLVTALTYAIASWNSYAAFMNNVVVTVELTVLTLALAGWSLTSLRKPEPDGSQAQSTAA